MMRGGGPGRGPDSRSRRRVRFAAVRGVAAGPLALAVLLCASACSGTEETISREEFIATYVALRVAELEEGGSVISGQARDSVLAARGVTEEDLGAFVEAHGTDVVFMAGIWTEVDSLMDERSGGADPER